MKLHKAIQAVAKFAASGAKSPDLYQAVMLISGVGDEASYVFATDGLMGCRVPVDVSLPTALVPLDAIKPIAKHKLSGVTRDDVTLTFHAVGGGAFKAKVKDAIAYPRPPSGVPTMVEYEDWNHVWPIVHAAADDKSAQGTFQNIRFREACVEATDAVRVAVADVAGWPQDLLVPARLLRGWRDGRVSLGVTDRLVFALRGEELRFAPVCAEGRYPDCKAHLPSAHTWPAVVVDTHDVREMVAKAIAVSPLKTVGLSFSPDGLAIKSWSAEEGGKGFHGRLHGLCGEPPVVAVKILNGKYVLQTLRAVRTPNVRLCYQDQADGPLRIESGALAECVWPWRT
jgi:hypothetical protein